MREGEQKRVGYRRLNRLGRVPTLVDDGQVLTQSLAILEYLEERYPTPPLLPAEPFERARVRALAQVVACDMHPVNNLSILDYLENELDIGADQRLSWYRHWIAAGFTALEAMLAEDPQTGRYCRGDAPGMADLCLVPQMYNARRFDCDLSAYPTLARIDAACVELEAFRHAAPECQPDAQT